MYFIRKYLDKLRPIFQSSYFGFIQGHSYLNEHQLSHIEDLLRTDNFQQITLEYEERLASLIGSGRGISFAAGRMAFFSLMKVLNIGKGDEVIITGHTCSVMLNAIFKTGAIPVFIDLDPDTFGSSPESIEIKITEKTKLIVAQHSFGIPCKIDKIVRIGKKYNIFVLEDSALSLDSSLSGVKVGNWGDAAIFSTDHSKPLNTLIGGLLYTKDEELYKKIKLYWEKIPQLTKDHQRRLFNQLVFERKYYNTSKYSLGRLLSSIKGKIPFVTNSNSFLEADYTKISSNDGRLYPYPAKIPIFLAKMGLYEMDRWNAEKEQRKELLNNFITLSKNLGINQYLPAAYFDSELEIVPHRFVYTHPDSEVIIKKMSKIIDVNWFWFKRPIIGCKDPSEFGYKYGSCPVSEKVGKGIINWPCVFNNSDNEQLLKYFKKVHK